MIKPFRANNGTTTDNAAAAATATATASALSQIVYAMNGLVTAVNRQNAILQNVLNLLQQESSRGRR